LCIDYHSSADEANFVLLEHATPNRFLEAHPRLTEALENPSNRR
jgi:hypothetical protein